MVKKRSIGITILSVLEILVGTIGVIYSIPRLSEITFIPGESIFSFICFLLMLIAGILTFRLNIIGWVFQLVFLLVALVGSIGSICFIICFIKAGMPFMGGGRNIRIDDILFLACYPLIPSLLLFYITRPKVKEQFKK